MEPQLETGDKINKQIEFGALLTPLTNKLFLLTIPLNLSLRKMNRSMSEAQIVQHTEFLLIAFSLHDIKNVPILKIVENGVSFLTRTSGNITVKLARLVVYSVLRIHRILPLPLT